MKYFCFILILSGLFLSILSDNLGAQATSFIKSTHTFIGRTIPYQIFEPDTLLPGVEYPMVLVLHGSGGRGDDNTVVENNYWIRNWADDYVQLNHPCFILVPQCPKQRRWADVINVVGDLVDSLMNTNPVDPGRIYVTGHSMGGWGAWEYSLTYPIRFAAVVPCAGTPYWLISAFRYFSYVPSVWSFAGSADTNSPVANARAIVDSMDANGYTVIKTQNYSGNQLDSILSINPPHLYTEYPGAGHGDMVDSVYFDNPRLINWLFNQYAATLPLPDPVYPAGTQTSSAMHPINFTYNSLQPVFSFDAPGTWDSRGVRAPAIIHDGDTLRMWYYGYNSTSPLPHIGYAWSLDGVTWHRYSNNPVISPTMSWENGMIAPGCVVKENNVYKMWYGANPQAGFFTAIGYATSNNGIDWIKYPNPVFFPGDIFDWDYVNIGKLTVINDGSQYLMWYMAGAAMTHDQIGLATSPDGINWIKYNDPQTNDIPYINSDPVVSFRSCYSDWESVLWPAVIKNGNGYHMLYVGTDSYESKVYYASSPDGIAWTKFIEYPVFNHRPAWTTAPDFEEGCFLETADGRLHYWYTCFRFDPVTGYLVEPQFGYSVDTKDLPIVSDFDLDRSFVRINVDTLWIKAKIDNQIGHNIDVNAKFYKSDITDGEIVPLFDDGMHRDSLAQDNIYGNYWICTEETLYSSVIEIDDLGNGFTYNSLVPFNLIKRVSSIGPVKLAGWRCNKDSLYAGLKVKFYFTLTNTGTMTTAGNISSQIVALDTFVIIDPLKTPAYGDIAPGDSAEGDEGQYIKFSSDCIYGQKIKFKQNIFSDGYLFWSDTFTVDLNTDIDNYYAKIPFTYNLKQNFPNPFNPTTNIEFSIPKTESVTLKIYNLLGQEVATLVSEKLRAGKYTYAWDASSVASGIYLYKLKAGSFVQTKKMVLMR